MKPLLRDISSYVEPGDRIALIGNSGAGKTLLLRLLNQLISPTTGSIYLDGSNYQDINPMALRQQVTLVLQETKLLGMTAGEAIAYPLKLRGMVRDDIHKRVNIWLERLAISQDILQLTEVQLASGQQQWIAIARGLVGEPDILLLDEPTTHLNQEQQKCLGAILKDFWGDKKMAIVATHQLDFARQFATRIWYLEEGKLVKDILTTEVNWQHLRQHLQYQQTTVDQEWDEVN